MADARETTHAMVALTTDDPRVVAWERYRATPDYGVSFRWAEFEEYRDGSMWAAFLEGWEAQQRDGWRPIETAPKDGTWVILATSEGVQPGFWGPTYFDYDPAWIVYSHRSDCQEVNGKPTHWMPLPAPPVQPSSDTGPGTNEQSGERR